MSTKYFCANCDREFVPEETGDKPRCPQCMRKGGVEPVQEAASRRGAGRSWLLISALVIVVAGIGYGVYRSTAVTLEETPPLRPLEASELSAYLERDQLQVGTYEAMMMLPDTLDAWPESAAEIAARMHRESASWSLERSLPREVLTADQVFAMIDAHEERVELYPLEAATAMTALLRERGVTAMVAEVWEFEGARAPADPSGMLGYFVTAVYGEGGSDEPSAYFDPWGGRGEVKVSSTRVLRDTEVLAAVLGTEAGRIFARSGDGSRALPMVETALLLDPVSPSLRAVNATVLVESGGLAQAVEEFEAALQLRPDGPRKLNLVQLHLARAGMLELDGQREAAEAQFSEGNRMVGEVIEKWPRYGRAHVVLATVHLGLNEPERARVELETAEALNPDAPMLWAVWAQYFLAQNDSVAAAAKMKRAVDLDPDNWQLRIQAARIFQGAGDDEAARENVAIALQLVSPDKRAEVRQFIERMMGPGALAPPSPQDDSGASESPIKP
jgi:Tfp pilus assembly protein PilF